MRTIDYTFLKEDYLPPSLLIYSSRIESSTGSCRLSIRQYPQLFDELRRIARIQSVKGSNAIEGIVTTDDRIRSIVAGDTSPANHSEEEIAGYRDALDLIHNRQQLPFDEYTIKGLHSLMMQLAGSAEAGEYKSEDNYISEVRADGSRTIRFRPVAADETDYMMEQLILAYDSASKDPKISRLLLIPCVIMDFLCIHPFTDGNGRISRLLSLLLLYKNGYEVCRYISLEQRINDTRAEYYEALRKSSEKWHEKKNDYMPFAEYFLKTLSGCYDELDSRASIVEGHKLTKAERIERTVVSSLVPISKKEICERLPDVSPTTVEAVLAKLLRNGIISKEGRGRATKYIRC